MPVPTTISQLAQLDLNGLYSYADYLRWAFEERTELIKGRLFPMSPAPSATHQRVARRLYHQFESFLSKHSCGCEFFPAPFDVRLPNKKKSSDQEVLTVVQPDLCVICDLSKIDERGCEGPPELVAEILSPGNSRREMNDKFALYEESGVLEYWIVDPGTRSVSVYWRDAENRFAGRPYPEGTFLPSRVLEGLHISVDSLFENT